MNEIPDDIWEAARGLRNAVCWQSNSAVEFIAKALNAERLAAEQRGREMEREDCAALCEGLSWQVDMSPDHVRSRRPADYAAAIRSRTTEG